MSAKQAIKQWHQLMENGSTREDLIEILDENAVFHSPVVHSPQVGRDLVVAYLSAAGKVLGGSSFEYVREVIDGNEAVLEFQNNIDGIHINGIDMIRFNNEGKIIDFKVMVRPMKAMNKLWELMAAELERQTS